MPAELSREEIREIVFKQLPGIIRTDPEIRQALIDLTGDRYADRERTGDRIDRVLDELKADRERSDQRWREALKRWDKNDQKWSQNEERWRKVEQQWRENEERWRKVEQQWRENERRWLKVEQKWQGNEERWRENERRWLENDRRWRENQKTTDRILNKLEQIDRRHATSIGALGARWGLRSEAAWRNGLKAILESSFNVTVERFQDFDYDGVVFGRPDQIELDVIIHNGDVILCEIKSAMTKANLYAFWRKTQFYEKVHDRRVNRKLCITPYIEDRAAEVAQELDIEVYSFADEVRIDPAD